MGQINYRKIFKKDHWGNFGIDACNKLKAESLLVTALPAAGKRYFLRHVREYYGTLTQDNDTIIISFEIIPGRTKILHLSQVIVELINFEIGFPKYLQDLSCEGTIREILKRGKKILITINRFERLAHNNNSLVFLESLRVIDQLRIRFLIGCDISCICTPDKYQASGILTSSNVSILPTFNKNELLRSIRIQNRLYGWRVPSKWAHRILSLSGGNPGLIKYIIKYSQENNPSILETQELINYPAIKLKLSNIVSKLTKYNLIKNGKPDLKYSKTLQDLGVLDKNKKLKIKLLQTLLEKSSKRIVINNLEKKLSPRETLIFDLFSSKFDEIISIDEIANELWGEKARQKFSLWATYKIISNINRKIRKFGLVIKNYRGRGYSLSRT